MTASGAATRAARIDDEDAIVRLVYGDPSGETVRLLGTPRRAVCFGTLALTTRTDNRARVLYGQLGYQVVACRSSALYRRFIAAPGRVLVTNTA